MKNRARLFGLLLVVLWTAGCSGVSLRSSWLSDAARSGVAISHIAIWTETTNKRARPIAEDLFVQQLSPVVKATATHRMFPDSDNIDLKALTEGFRVKGVDAVLVTRMVDENTIEVPTANYTPPYEVRRFSRYYDRYVLVQPEPRYSLKSVTRYTFESRLYRLSDQELLWTGISEGFAEDSIYDISTHMADRIAEDLRAKGVI